MERGAANPARIALVVGAATAVIVSLLLAPLVGATACPAAELAGGECVSSSFSVMGWPVEPWWWLVAVIPVVLVTTVVFVGMGMRQRGARRFRPRRCTPSSFGASTSRP